MAASADDVTMADIDRITKAAWACFVLGVFTLVVGGAFAGYMSWHNAVHGTQTVFNDQGVRSRLALILLFAILGAGMSSVGAAGTAVSVLLSKSGHWDLRREKQLAFTGLVTSIVGIGLFTAAFLTKY